MSVLGYVRVRQKSVGSGETGGIGNPSFGEGLLNLVSQNPVQ